MTIIKAFDKIEKAYENEEAGDAGEPRLKLTYESDAGSLKEDTALKTHLIPDEDERWEWLRPCGGLKKFVINRPKNRDARVPSMGEKVSCHYSIFLRDTGEMLISTRSRKHVFVFVIGEGSGEDDSVVKGLEMGIDTMQLGERAILRCSSEFAYCEKWSSLKVLPPKAVDLVVQLYDFSTWGPIWDISCTEDLIYKKTIKDNYEWETARELWTVTVSYTGREFDDTGRIWCCMQDEKLQIPLDLVFENKGFIPEYDQPRGFYTCLTRTTKGEVNHFKLKCSEAYTFGSNGSDKYLIASNTDLFYEIQITALEKLYMTDKQLFEGEKLPRAKELKVIANQYFKQKKLLAAKWLYKQIIKIVPRTRDQSDENTTIMVTCLSNIALVEMQLNNLSEAMEKIDKGLRIAPKHQKLRFRKALILFKHGDFVYAKDFLTQLEEEFPDNNAIKSLAKKNARALRVSENKAKKVFRNMFQSRA